MKLTIIQLTACLVLVSLYALALYIWRRLVDWLTVCADRVLTACHL